MGNAPYFKPAKGEDGWTRREAHELTLTAQGLPDGMLRILLASEIPQWKRDIIAKILARRPQIL